MPSRSAVLLAMAALLLSGCGQALRPAPLLADGGFEQGLGPWHVIAGDPNWIQPETSTQLAWEGNASLHTHLVAKSTTGFSVIAGALQQVPMSVGQAMPASLRGHYFVRNWTSNAAKTYIQAVVMLYADNATTEVQCQDLPNQYPCQVAFVLGGVSERPLNVANRKFVFVATAVPQRGHWMDFDLPVAQAFRDQWAAADGVSREFRVYLEVRYEKATADDGHSADADVFWDGIALA